jgi:hypothetical protein
MSWFVYCLLDKPELNEWMNKKINQNEINKKVGTRKLRLMKDPKKGLVIQDVEKRSDINMNLW